MTATKRIFDNLRSRAQDEFDTTGDFIWKSPRFIDGELKLELNKLESYYPLSGDKKKDSLSKKLWKLRAARELGKLNSSFPYLMSIGNVFTAFSLFETYCLLLCKSIEPLCGTRLKDVNGSGMSRLFKHLLQCGIKLDRVPFRQEILIAAKIRNCLFHANGLLLLSREEDELRAIVAQAKYLSKEHQLKHIELKQKK